MINSVYSIGGVPVGKRAVRFSALILLAFVLLFTAMSPSALADRTIKEKPANYIGAMRVIWCKEFVSLREEPKKTSKRILEVPLGAIVYSCTDIHSAQFYQCEYEGTTGYILRVYLEPAPECEPPASSAITKKMTMDEITGSGEIVLDWKDYNMSVIASHDYITEDKKEWEVLRIGCFIDGSPIWGHEEKCEKFGQYDALKTFIGGVEDDWVVMVYDGAYGLSKLDLLSGKEKWSLTTGTCPMGNAAAITVDKEGTIYIAGTDGPDPVAVLIDGQVLWKSDVGDPTVYGPYEIEVQNGSVMVKYDSGMEDGYKLVTFSAATGELISIRNQRNEN